MVALPGLGPRLLLSDASTATQGTIRWRLRVCGNTAVEFGVVPAEADCCHSTLHKVRALDGATGGACMRVARERLARLESRLSSAHCDGTAVCRVLQASAHAGPDSALPAGVSSQLTAGSSLSTKVLGRGLEGSPECTPVV